jgi:UDP-N-acetylmuramate dehydrogenase
VDRAILLSRDGTAVVEATRAEMGFDYDKSRVQATGEFILAAVFRLEEGGSPAALRKTARESLEHRKRTQPLRMPSAGCIFQNPDPASERLPVGTAHSAGALIDRAGLKGHRVGAARVSPVHANFIVNEGGATASDVMALIERCRAEVLRCFAVRLKLEIRLLGF